MMGGEARRDEAVAALEITSDAFEYGGAIPRRHSCDAESVSPPLAFGDLPEGNPSLAFVVDDPDAPVGTWLGSGIDLAAGGLGEGRNGFGTVGYAGPVPAAPPSRARRRARRALDGHVER
jgi:phosphatidylethanolamine-binding protein (PEBP) family uncharacterized protein